MSDACPICGAIDCDLEEQPMSDEQPLTLADIESRVLALPEREDLTPEQCCQLITDIDTAVHRARDAKAALEAFLIQWLPQNGGELVVGPVRYVVTDKRTVKCRDVAATVKELLDATGGDIDAACGALSSNAVKQGEAKKILGPDVWGRCFEVTYEADLEQKRIKQLARLDGRFMPK